MCKFVILIALLANLQVNASPANAQLITRQYELSAETWALKLKLATTPEEKQELWDKRPDPAATATELWSSIAPSLAEDWTIPHAAFFLNITRNLTTIGPDGNVAAAFSRERQRIVAAFTENHLRKPGIGAFTIALVDNGAPQALPLLEKIIAENPDKATQGIASLAAALLLRNLGDTPELIAKRLNHLRDAIIKSVDEKIGDSSVGYIAAEEIYVIKNLTKGRHAPDFSGTDVAGRVVRLSDFKGKVTVVLFWDAKTAETDRIIELTNRLVEKNVDKPVTIIGITPESLDRIRELQAQGAIKWNSIIDPTEKISTEYRISSRPAVFVLDQAGNIEFTGMPGSFVDLTVDALLTGAPATGN